MKRSAAARCTAWPPSTEPVKATKSTRGSAISRAVCSCDRCSALEQAFRQAGRAQAVLEALGAQRRLRRMLQQHRVARHQRRYHAVDRDQVGIIPGRDREHDAERLAPQEAAESVLRPRVDVGERIGGDGDHVARALERAAHFAGRVVDRPAHLPGQLGRDLAACPPRSASQKARQIRARSATGVQPPAPLRLARLRERRVDRGIGCEFALAIHRAVDRADGLLRGQMISK